MNKSGLFNFNFILRGLGIVGRRADAPTVTASKDHGEDDQDHAEDIKEQGAEENAGLVLEHDDQGEYGPDASKGSKAYGKDKGDRPDYIYKGSVKN